MDSTKPHAELIQPSELSGLRGSSDQAQAGIPRMDGRLQQHPADSPIARHPMILYALTIFLSAFLLFQVQPLIAKIILPWFGGSAAVWSAALLFFQLVVLGGYFYAHCLIRYLKPKQQFYVQAGLL